MTLKDITEISAKQLSSGLFLVLVKATSTPPHLALCYNGHYYSLTNKGLDLDKSTTAILELISRKKLPSLFIELDVKKIDLPTDFFHFYFNKYQSVSPPTTCLSPIKDTLKKLYSLDLSTVEYVFDLLPLLGKNNEILNTYQLNMESYLSDNSFTLKRYTKQQIFESIIPKKQLC